MNTRTRPLTLCRVVAAAAPLALAGLCATALPSAAYPADTGNPAGNNGIVAITPHGEDDGIPQSTPLVPCTFDIEWYGFDEGPDITSTVEFTMHGQSSEVGLVVVAGPSEVFVGYDPARGAGTDSGFDGEATYSLAFDSPQPAESHQVKVTVRTPGSQGADTKHKVFWVEHCDEPPPPPIEL